MATQAAVAARKATSTIPIVAISVTDPIGLGLVESLARPGGNVTGLAFSVGLDILSKCLEFLKEAVPGLQMVALLVDPTNPFHAAVFVVADTLFVTESAQIAKLALKYQLPSMRQLREEVEAGGLLSYGTDFTDLFRRAAMYVDAIFKGCKACGSTRPAADEV